MFQAHTTAGAPDARLESSIWTLPDGLASNDWPAYSARLAVASERCGLRRESLGDAFGYPLWLLTPERRRGLPRLLIASGFHGEEAAGPWAVLQMLETADPALFEQAEVSVLPLVNVSGFAAGRRFNRAGENPNRGFRPQLDGVAASVEGRLLLAQAARIAELGCDGVIACHEDIDVAGGYVYSYERRDAPGGFGLALRDAAAAIVPLHQDGSVDGCPVRDGIIFNQYDSSFESWAMSLGVAYAACTETPGLLPIERRIRAHLGMIEAFLRYRPALSLGNDEQGHPERAAAAIFEPASA